MLSFGVRTIDFHRLHDYLNSMLMQLSEKGKEVFHIISLREETFSVSRFDYRILTFPFPNDHCMPMQLEGEEAFYISLL